MEVCEVCGNDYDKSLVILRGDERHVFDSFECAINALAPHCSHCGCKIIGHGIESDNSFYCCAHCAHVAGVQEAVDRVSRVRFRAGRR